MKKRMLILVMVGLLALIGIALATSTMNPRITYTGNGIPDPDVGRVGDMYIDLDTNILYVMATDGWGVFAVLPSPVNGTDGLDGATWIVGGTEPASEIGNNGDLYFNYPTLDIYYKTNDVWTYLVNIQGQTGPQGETGPAGQDGVNGTNGIDGINGIDGRNGSIWYNELAFNLTDDLGYDGDYYIFTNGTVYYKMNGTWVYFTSLAGLTGPQGPQGETGQTGPQGETGETGPQGPAGTDGINGIDGLDGKDGETAATGLARVDSSVPWWLYVVAAGCVGASCYSVYKSRKKNENKKENA